MEKRPSEKTGRDLERHEIRFRAVRVLRAAKKYIKLKELSSLTGISMPLISRYINGKILPNYATSQVLLKSVLKREVVASILLKGLTSARLPGGPVYALDLAAGDPDILYLIAEYIAHDVERDFDVIVTPEAGGITFASALALVTGKRLVIAAKRKPIEGDYIEVPVIRDPANIKYYYIPKYPLEPAEAAIIVDDFSVRGATIRALRDALEANGVGVEAIYLIVALGEEWAKIPGARAILTL